MKHRVVASSAERSSNLDDLPKFLCHQSINQYQQLMWQTYGNKAKINNLRFSACIFITFVIVDNSVFVLTVLCHIIVCVTMR